MKKLLLVTLLTSTIYGAACPPAPEDGVDTSKIPIGFAIYKMPGSVPIPTRTETPYPSPTRSEVVETSVAHVEGIPMGAAQLLLKYTADIKTLRHELATVRKELMLMRNKEADWQCDMDKVKEELTQKNEQIQVLTRERDRAKAQLTDTLDRLYNRLRKSPEETK